MSDHEPRPDAPTPGPYDEADGGPLDPQHDPRVEAVLHALTAALSQPPDELTRRRHLAAMRDARRAQHRRRALRRVGRAGVMAATLLVALAVAGALPDPLQRSMADAATLVGITLPAPAPATPAADEEPHAPADDADPGADDGPSDAAGERDDVGHAPDHAPPTAPRGGTALGPTADRGHGGGEAPALERPGTPETATGRGRPAVRGQRPPADPGAGPHGPRDRSRPGPGPASTTTPPGRTDAEQGHGEAPGRGGDTRRGARHPRDRAEAGRPPGADGGARPVHGG